MNDRLGHWPQGDEELPLELPLSIEIALNGRAHNVVQIIFDGLDKGTPKEQIKEKMAEAALQQLESN